MPNDIDDERFMQEALVLAERGRGRVEPNPLVGAVIVRDGQVVGRGWHREYGHAHAEVEALRDAGTRAEGSTVYVTLEPCAHQGKTPPCTDALIAARVGRVVFACDDPNPVARGGGEVLRAAGIEVVSGVGREVGKELKARFFHSFSAAGAARPWVEVKLALTLDARVGDSSGRSKWITGPEARAEVHRLRAGHDAIAVGIGTVLADDPQLTVRTEPPPRRPPIRLVFDRRLRLPPSSTLARTAHDKPVWVVCGEDAPAAAEAELSSLGVGVLRVRDLPQALQLLRDRGVESIFCEGGGTLVSAFLEGNQVDRLSLFYAPLVLGSGARDAFSGLSGRSLENAMRWRRIRTATFGDDTLIVLAP